MKGKKNMKDKKKLIGYITEYDWKHFKFERCARGDGISMQIAGINLSKKDYSKCKNIKVCVTIEKK